ncbi:MAG: DUF302 domain-containing protein [Candidatus Cloacimonetes bacterium]|nr:DUF302 domain-containing protein [Candidatus Cloacimonadota bacterium]
MMLSEDESPYGFDETIEILTQSVDDHGWTIPKTHNLQRSMAKFGHEVLPVTVIELCHPDHANRILQEDDERIVATLMPCRVAVYEKSDGKVYISRMNSGMLAGMMGGLIAEVMSLAAAQNEEILQPVLK